MQAARRADKTQSVNRQPSLAVGPARRRMERKLQDAGVFCQPGVSIQYQTIAKRSVLRGVESGGFKQGHRPLRYVLRRAR
jgi:hypothetical protein